MYLKTLTLKGFKSFCDRSRLSFDPGLTVVVGPNGSGKSNISDAILWVLGEQSAKALRGQAMEDVVFAGSRERPAVSVAEVTLVLDNADGAIPLDFSEISITRRMYRSGESEYLVNSAPARLRDIRDLLHDMGLGRDTHSIISQGRLGEVLQSRPEERRELIEEAAGIAKFRQRKERAERKLERLEEDIRRIKDYARLLKREMRPLKKQVDQVRAYRELKERESTLETVLAVDDLRRLQEKWQNVSQKANEAQATVELSRYELTEKEKELAHVKKLLEEKGLFVGDLGALRHRAEKALQNVGAAERLLKEKGRHIHEQLAESTRQRLAHERELNHLAQELLQNEERLKAAKKEHQKVSAALERLEPQEATLRATAKKDAQEMERAKKKTQKAHRWVNEVTLSHAKLQQKLQSAILTQELFDGRVQEVAANEAAARDAQQEQEALLAHLSDLEAQTRKRSSELKQTIARLTSERDRAKKSRAEAEAALFEATTEKSTLEKLSQKERSAQSCQNLVAKRMAREGEVPRQLFERLEISQELQGALATYLGEDLFGFLCSSVALEKTLAQALSGFAGGGRVSLIAAKNDTESPAPPAEEDLQPLGVSVGEPAAQSASEARLMAQLFCGVYGVSDVQEGLDLAERYPNARAFLGRDGSVVFGDGRVRLGKPAPESTQALARARRLRELNELVPRYDARFQEADGLFATAERSLGEALARERSLAQELAAMEARAKAAQREVGRVKERSERAQRERIKLERQQKEALRDIAGDRSRLDALDGELHEAKAHLAQCQKAMPALDEAATGSLARANELKDELTAKKLSARHLAEQMRSLSSSVDALKERERHLCAEQRSRQDAIATLEVLEKRVEPLQCLLEELHEQILKKVAVLSDKSSIAQADSATLKKAVQTKEAQVKSAQKAIMSACAELAQTQAETQVIEEAVCQATQKVQDLHTLELEEALKLKAPQDRKGSEEELLEIRQRIEALGPVNGAALSHYEAAKERLETVQDELADLSGAKDALSKISRAIERKMRRRFLDTFNQVNANFSEIFQMLFAGGSAKLEMLDPTHPQTTGIEICAQPPKKRVAKMTLLSGGERSLTALALLFAVYQTRTVPFYVFDEVEQALDDANLNKLLQSLTMLKQKTQLIVISHQRRTMEKADVLYGVSMGSDGVSRALSQRLSDMSSLVSHHPAKPKSTPAIS